MIKDRNVAWRRKRIYINAMHFLDEIGTAGVRVCLGQGAAVAKEINSLDMAGVLIEAAGADGSGDEFRHHMPVPYDLDPDDEVGFRVNWCCASTTDADDVEFVMLAAFYAENGTVVKAAGALDTVIPADTVGDGAAYAQRWTSRGIKNAGFLTRAQVEEGLAMMNMEIRCSVDDPSGDTFILGLQIDYKVRATD